MDEMKNVIFGFMVVFVGVVLLGAVADEQVRVTQANSVVNESVVLVNASAVSLDNNQLDSLSFVGNASDTLTVNTDYTVDLSAGTVTSLGPAGTFNASYVYREVGSATARTLTSLITLFFALGVMGLGLAMALKGLRDAGVLGK